MKHLITTAVQAGALVRMIYCTDASVVSQRIIRIYAIKQDYMQAFCFTKKQHRTFKVSNVLAVETIGGGIHHESA